MDEKETSLGDIGLASLHELDENSPNNTDGGMGTDEVNLDHGSSANERSDFEVKSDGGSVNGGIYLSSPPSRNRSHLSGVANSPLPETPSRQPLIDSKHSEIYDNGDIKVTTAQLQDTTLGMAKMWDSKLSKLPAQIKQSREAKSISEDIKGVIKACKKGIHTAPDVACKCLGRVRENFEKLKALEEGTFKGDFAHSFQTIFNKAEIMAKQMCIKAEVKDFIQTSEKNMEKVLGVESARKLSNHMRRISENIAHNVKDASEKGDLTLRSLIAASKLQAFERQMKTRYHKVKRDVKQTLLAHMEATVRDLTLIHHGNASSNLDLKNYDLIPYVLAPVLLNSIYWSTFLNLVAALLYTIIILCLLTFDYEDACDDGIQYWFGFKMCLEALSGISSFWSFMQVRAWCVRYEASYNMAEARTENMMDENVGGTTSSNARGSKKMLRFKLDHMISQGKDSLQTFREITSGIPWMMTKVLVFITIFYDIGAIYLADNRHCAECGATALEFGIYIWSFWIVATMMYRICIVLANFYFLLLRLKCCQRRLLAHANVWDEYIGIGVITYIVQKILVLSESPKWENKAQRKKLMKLMKEQTKILKKYSDLDQRIRQTKADIRQEERRALFRGELGVKDLHSADNTPRTSPVTKSAMDGKTRADFKAMFKQANETIFEEET
eukprot:CAMPEP_0184495954 /NCGR_PEP_ID=MMETSP0113_2-20130426/32765_1 /TAXON_ID=91329 /ORGANISM="Norrisiella sphaerica, Strain BC52" /LENGTH=669 /DNA_ID=CAMNT_0026882385 /DNA_START=370 /DNA_END=2379 /DNA_ORIENTATION=-